MKAMKAVESALAAVENFKRLKATTAPAEQAKSASDGVARETEDIGQLRDALRTGTQHPRIMNLRRVQPRVGQKVQVTC